MKRFSFVVFFYKFFFSSKYLFENIWVHFLYIYGIYIANRFIFRNIKTLFKQEKKFDNFSAYGITKVIDLLSRQARDAVCYPVREQDMMMR